MAGATTDVPDKLLPLLTMLACWQYWIQIVSMDATQRELFPDMTPEEALKVAESFQKQFETLLKTVRNAK